MITPVAGARGLQRLGDPGDHAGACLLCVGRLQAEYVVLVLVGWPEVQREEACVLIAGLRGHVDGTWLLAREEADGEAVEVEDSVIHTTASIGIEKFRHL